MTHMLMTAMMALIMGFGTASAQMGASAPSPLGITSPLGIGPAPAVPPAGIPLGNSEMGSLGVSPTTSGVSPMTPTTSTTPACSFINSAAGNLSGTSPSATMSGPMGSGTTALFDAGGIAGTASGTCTGMSGSAASSSPSTMSSPSGVGRIGVPLGSTELGVGGLSPMPTIPSLNPMAPSLTAPTLTPGTPCPTTATTSMSAMSSGSC